MGRKRTKAGAAGSGGQVNGAVPTTAKTTTTTTTTTTSSSLSSSSPPVRLVDNHAPCPALDLPGDDGPTTAAGLPAGASPSPPLVTPGGMTRFLPWRVADASASSSPPPLDKGSSAAIAFVKKAYATGQKMMPQNRKDMRDQTKIRHTYSLSRQSSLNYDSFQSAESSLGAEAGRSMPMSTSLSADESGGLGGLGDKVERTVLFNDGSSYSGEWRGKHIEGRGVFMWANGDRFEGEWKHDVQDGQGTYAAADGSMYYGGWRAGVKDGDGVYKPAVSDASDAEPRLYLRRYEDGVLVKETVLDLAKEAKGKLKQKHEKHRQKNEAVRDSKLKEMQRRPLKPGEVIYKGHHSYDLMRQLQLGIMFGIAQESGGVFAGEAAGEAAGETAGSGAPGAPADTMKTPAGVTSGARSADHPQTPPKTPAAPLLSEMPVELTKKDYSAVLVQNFPASNVPAFEYKEYIPKLFRVLRMCFMVDSADYLVSITGGPALREMPSPGASGCIFFLSEDDRFFIKSVRKDEMGIVLSFMKHYQRYVCRNPATLLVKFFGIHRISPWFGRNARFVVMGNVLPTEKRMHRKFDLKGSTYKRTVGTERLQDPNATLKDLDLDMSFLLSPSNYEKLMSTLQEDVNFLAQRNLIDYSLLLGVHVIAWGEHEWHPPGEGFRVGGPDDEEGAEQGGNGRESTQQASSRSLDNSRYHSLAFSRNLVQNVDSLELQSEDSEMVKSAATLIGQATSVRDAARTSAASASAMMEFSHLSATWSASTSMVGDRDRDLERTLGHGASIDESSIGWAMPAIAVQKGSDGVDQKAPVLLYFGIIDFLQKYNTRKRLEKLWKQTVQGPGVSITDPARYADRFMRCMKTKVFVNIGSGSRSGSLPREGT